ncbi:HEAT repeat domain-containing protein [Chloroflexota bacterium]
MSLLTGETIAELADSDKPLLSSRLADLPKFNSTELELLEKTWIIIDPKRRRQIIDRLVDLGKEEAPPHLIKLIDDADTNVRFVAIQVLGKIGDSEAKECLQLCLNNANEVIR